MTYVMRYSLTHRGQVYARRSLRYKASNQAAALQVGATWLCNHGYCFAARITSLRPA